MYNGEFWDEIYKNNSDAAPWMTDDWANFNIKHICKYVGELKNKELLDYGCGNAYIGDYFYTKGANLSLAEVSSFQVAQLRKKYRENVGIERVDYPRDIKQRDFYDYILCIGVFHHINPSLWDEFLNDMHLLLKENGILIISGWDERDPVLMSENYKGHMTNKDCWCINDLKNKINPNFNMDATFVDHVKLNAFSICRICRFFVLSKK